MTDPLTQAFETIRGRIINIEQGLDNLTERIKDLQKNHNQQIGQIERLFTFYKETRIELDDIKKNMNKNYIDTILDELPIKRTKKGEKQEKKRT